MANLEHDVAIELSRALNLVNANDLLARQVIQIARNHTQVGAFVKGTDPLPFFSLSTAPPMPMQTLMVNVRHELTSVCLSVVLTCHVMHTLSIACAAFGKFQETFLFDIYLKIQNHDREHGVNGPSGDKQDPKGNGTAQGPAIAMSGFTRSFDEEDETPAPVMKGGLVKTVKASTDDVRNHCLFMQLFTITI